MPPDTIIALCACPEEETATRIADALVERGLAACVSLIPGITSVYQWQGQKETTREVLMLIKTRTTRYPELERAILTMHPYELPELIAVPVSMGLPNYLHWLAQCTDTSR